MYVVLEYFLYNSFIIQKKNEEDEFGGEFYK